MSTRHRGRQKVRRAARDLRGDGATLAQIDRLFAWGVIGHRVYDRLATPLLDAQDAAQPRVRITWAEIFPSEGDDGPAA